MSQLFLRELRWRKKIMTCPNFLCELSWCKIVVIVKIIVKSSIYRYMFQLFLCELSWRKKLGHICRNIFYANRVSVKSLGYIYVATLLRELSWSKITVTYICRVIYLRGRNFRGYKFSRIFANFANLAKINTREKFLNLQFAKILRKIA